MSKGRYTCTCCRQDFHDHCTNLRCPIAWHHLMSIGAQDVKDIQAEDIGDPLEERSTESFQLGHVSMLEDLPKRFQARAGEAFAAGKDDRAHFWRDLAKELEKEARELREKWTKRFHPERLK